MLTDLATTPIAETIRRLSAERLSGDLHVRSAKLIKLLFFDHGRIVFAASNLKKDRLGEALVALGRISGEDFERVSALMKGEQKKRFGDALVHSGLMDKNELGTSVARQVRRIALSIFELPEGAASFEERRCVIPLEFMVSLSIHKLLYEGIKTMGDSELILSGLGNLDRAVQLAPIPPFLFEGKRSAEEKEILELAERRVTVRRLAWASGGGLAPAWTSGGGLAASRLKTVYALCASGILESAEEDASPRPIVTMETGTFLLSALQRRPDPSSQEAIQQEVQDELEHSALMEKENWLKVARTAPRDELIKALEEKMERYHALREAVGDDEHIKTDIEVIIGRASAMLRLTRQAPPQSKPPLLPKASTPPPIGLRKPATPAAAVPPVIPPVSPSAAPPSDPFPPAREPARAVAPAPEPAAAPAGPAFPVASTSPAGHEGGVGAGSSNFAGAAQIEHLLMEGEVRMTVSDYANAVTVFQKLVQIAPKIPKYRVRLAIAMTCYPRTAKQAEREFFEALRLDPDNADTHYQFGLYYKAMKARSRAIAEMRTAVQLNPRHERAAEELASLAPKDSALSSLRKLFK
jgi:tetratricopeptide (TPR) repeat protein